MHVDDDSFRNDYRENLEKVRSLFLAPEGDNAWVQKFKENVGPETDPVWLKGLPPGSFKEYRDSLQLGTLLSDIARKYLRLPHLQAVLSIYAEVAIKHKFPYKQGNIVPVAAMFVEALEEVKDREKAEVVTRQALESLVRPKSSTRAALEGRSALLKWSVCSMVEEEAPWLYEGWFGKVRLDNVIKQRTREASLTNGEATPIETQFETPFQHKFFVSCSPLLWMQEPATTHASPEQAERAFIGLCTANRAYISYVKSTATELAGSTPNEANRHGLADLAGALVEMLVKAKPFFPSDDDNDLKNFDVFGLLRPKDFSIRGAQDYARRINSAAWLIEELRPEVPFNAPRRQQEAADLHAQTMEQACAVFCAQMRTRALRTLRRQRIRNVHAAAVGVGAAALGLGYAAWTNRRPVATRSPQAAPARHEAPPVHSAARPPPAGQSAPSSASTQALRGGS